MRRCAGAVYNDCHKYVPKWCPLRGNLQERGVMETERNNVNSYIFSEMTYFRWKDFLDNVTVINMNEEFL